jgi:hypothetical protein
LRLAGVDVVDVALELARAGRGVERALAELAHGVERAEHEHGGRRPAGELRDGGTHLVAELGEGDLAALERVEELGGQRAVAAQRVVVGRSGGDGGAEVAREPRGPGRGVARLRLGEQAARASADRPRAGCRALAGGSRELPLNLELPFGGADALLAVAVELLLERAELARLGGLLGGRADAALDGATAAPGARAGGSGACRRWTRALSATCSRSCCISARISVRRPSSSPLRARSS